MKTTNSTLTKMARESLDGQWGLAVLGSFIYFIVLMGVQLLAEIDPLLTIVSIIVMFASFKKCIFHPNLEVWDWEKK
jgi:uncharacterized membrane protein